MKSQELIMTIVAVNVGLTAKPCFTVSITYGTRVMFQSAKNHSSALSTSMS